MLASNRAIEIIASRRQQNSTSPTYEQILQAAVDEKPWASDLIERQYRAVGEGLRLVLPFAPEVIVFAGQFTALWERYAALLSERVKPNAMPGYQPSLVATEDADQARLRAASALVSQMSYREGISSPISQRETSVRVNHKRRPAVTLLNISL